MKPAASTASSPGPGGRSRRKSRRKPNSPPPPEAAERAKDEAAHAALGKAVANPGGISGDDLAALPGHLDRLGNAHIKEHLKALGLKVGGAKAELAKRLADAVRAKVAGAAPVPPPKSETPAPGPAPVAPPPAPVAPPPAPPAPAKAPPPPAERVPASADLKTAVSRIDAGLAAVHAGTRDPKTLVHVVSSFTRDLSPDDRAADVPPTKGPAPRILTAGLPRACLSPAGKDLAGRPVADGFGPAGHPQAKEVGFRYAGETATHAQIGSAGKAAFKAANPFSKHAPNGKLPDQARPPVADKKTAGFLNGRPTWGYDGPLNTALRQTGGPPPGELGGAGGGAGKPDQSGPKMFAALRAQFAAAKPFKPPVRVARGLTVTGDTADRLAAAARHPMATGSEATMSGFVSTTAGANAHGGNVQFSINATHGLDMKPYSHYPGENELLLDHGSRFRVTGVRQVEGNWVIEMDHVPAGNGPGVQGPGSSYTGGSQIRPGPTPFPRKNGHDAARTRQRGRKAGPASPDRRRLDAGSGILAQSVRGPRCRPRPHPPPHRPRGRPRDPQPPPPGRLPRPPRRRGRPPGRRAGPPGRPGRAGPAPAGRGRAGG